MSDNPTLFDSSASEQEFPAAPRLTPDGHLDVPESGAAATSIDASKIEDSTISTGDDTVRVGSLDTIPSPERSVEDRLLEEPSGPLTLTTGLEVELRPLKLREFLKLLKIITRGGASILGTVNLDFNDTEGFISDLLAVILFAVPEAEEEVADFIAAVCKPTALTGNPEKDQEVYQLALETFDNPDLVDVLDIITLLVRTEGRDLQALGKRLRAMFAVAQKMGATK